MSNGNREIERKYLLTALPPRVRTAPAVHIDQGYLPGVRINERVRRSTRDGVVRYHRTIKSGVGIEKLEIEEEIDGRFFAAVWPLTLGHRVEKRRYEVPDGEFLWEIDEFLDRSGLLAGGVRRAGSDGRGQILESRAIQVSAAVSSEV